MLFQFQGVKFEIDTPHDNNESQQAIKVSID